MEQLIETLGYLGVFLGVTLEGEVVVLTATYLAREGLFSPVGVGLTAFAGSVATYQACFWLGRRHGRALLERRPGWQPRVAWIQRQIARRQIPLIVGYRMLFGLRAATPFALGLSGVSPIRFSAIDCPIAAIWAASLVGAGLALGEGIAVAVEQFGAAVTWMVVAVALGVAAIALHRYTRGG